MFGDTAVIAQHLLPKGEYKVGSFTAASFPESIYQSLWITYLLFGWYVNLAFMEENFDL